MKAMEAAKGQIKPESDPWWEKRKPEDTKKFKNPKFEDIQPRIMHPTK